MIKGVKSLNGDILKLIPEGKANARSMNELAALAGMNERTFRKAVELHRLDGAIICSSCGGYYTPANVDELREFYKAFHRRAMTNLASLKAAGKMLKALENGGRSGE